MDLQFIIPVFCVATMFAMGLDITISDALAPLRNLLALGIIVLINNVFVPLLGFVVLAMPTLLATTPLAGIAESLVPLADGQAIGFLLLLLCAGSLLGPPLAEIAGAPAPFARGVMVVLVVVSAVLVPFELELLCGFKNIPCAAATSENVTSGALFMTLLRYQLLPLAVGIVIKAGYDAVAVRLRPLVIQLTSLSFFVLLGLIVMSSLALDLTPDQAPVAESELFRTAILTSTTVIDGGEIPSELRDEFGAREVALPTNTDVLVKEAGASWVIVNADRTYSVTVGDDGASLSVFNANLPGGAIALCRTGSSEQTLAECTADLDKGQITSQLRDEFAQESGQGQQGVVLLSDLVVVLTEGGTWALVTGSETYFLAAENGQLAVSQQVSQPVGLVGEFLKSLESLPVIGPVIDFLTQLVGELLPFAMLVAVAGLILLIGNYGGVAVRNVAGGDGDGIPHALATSTTARNVSMALILASEYFVEDWSALDGDDEGIVAIAMVLVFYLISLAVAAHQAVQWGKETATATSASDSAVTTGLVQGIAPKA